MQLKWIFEAEWIWVSTNMLHWGQHMGKSRRRWHEFPLWGCASGTFSWSKIAHQFLGIEMYFYFLKIGTHTHTHSNWELMFKPLQVLYLSSSQQFQSQHLTSLPQQLASFHSILLYVYFQENKKSHQFQATQDGFSLVAIFRNLKQTHFGWWFPPTFPWGSAVPLWTSPLQWIAQPPRSYGAWKMAKWFLPLMLWWNECFGSGKMSGNLSPGGNEKGWEELFASFVTQRKRVEIIVRCGESGWSMRETSWNVRQTHGRSKGFPSWQVISCQKLKLGSLLSCHVMRRYPQKGDLVGESDSPPNITPIQACEAL